MSGWDPRGHRTPQQKRREQDPLVRRLNKAAQLAPSVQVPTVRCAECGQVEMAHGPKSPCTGWVEP